MGVYIETREDTMEVLFRAGQDFASSKREISMRAEQSNHPPHRRADASTPKNPAKTVISLALTLYAGAEAVSIVQNKGDLSKTFTAKAIDALVANINPQANVSDPEIPGAIDIPGVGTLTPVEPLPSVTPIPPSETATPLPTPTREATATESVVQFVDPKTMLLIKNDTVLEIWSDNLTNPESSPVVRGSNYNLIKGETPLGKATDWVITPIIFRNPNPSSQSILRVPNNAYPKCSVQNFINQSDCEITVTDSLGTDYANWARQEFAGPNDAVLVGVMPWATSKQSWLPGWELDSGLFVYTNEFYNGKPSSGVDTLVDYFFRLDPKTQEKLLYFYKTGDATSLHGLVASVR